MAPSLAEPVPVDGKACIKRDGDPAAATASTQAACSAPGMLLSRRADGPVWMPSTCRHAVVASVCVLLASGEGAGLSCRCSGAFVVLLAQGFFWGRADTALLGSSTAAAADTAASAAATLPTARTVLRGWSAAVCLLCWLLSCEVLDGCGCLAAVLMPVAVKHCCCAALLLLPLEEEDATLITSTQVC